MEQQPSVTVTVPASAANLGPGFDCLGLALSLYNRVRMTLRSEGIQVNVRGEGAGEIPVDASNMIVQAAQKLWASAGQTLPGLALTQENNVPVASGLGSSAAAIVAGMLAANALLDEPLPRADVLALAAAVEGHPDNVAASLYGALVLTVADGEKFLVERIETPPLRVVVVLPDVELATSEARAALPKSVPLADAVFNASHTALLVRALAAGDFDLLRVAVRDRLHQPYRVPLIAGMEAAFQAAYDAGAAAVALSGAGPGVIAFAVDNHYAIGNAIEAAFAATGVGSRSWSLSVDRKGAVVSPVARP